MKSAPVIPCLLFATQLCAIPEATRNRDEIEISFPSVLSLATPPQATNQVVGLGSYASNREEDGRNGVNEAGRTFLTCIRMVGL